ncbi:MAG: hypothetical protein EA400_17805 [Chromatiaceae bacterium]|nr:MAG: hypothetical protein EA400_17805 [Chromatiaceae bacterium]
MHPSPPTDSPPRRPLHLLAGLLLLVATLGSIQSVALAGERLQVVYHVADENKVVFALNNIANHIEGAGGADQVEIVLVTHGDAVKRFIDIEAVDRVRRAVAELQQQGVTFEACAKTLELLRFGRDELLDGFIVAEQGGVTRIAELQSQGYVYLRP